MNEGMHVYRAQDMYKNHTDELWYFAPSGWNPLEGPYSRGFASKQLAADNAYLYLDRFEEDKLGIRATVSD